VGSRACLGIRVSRRLPLERRKALPLCLPHAVRLVFPLLLRLYHVRQLRCCNEGRLPGLLGFSLPFCLPHL